MVDKINPQQLIAQFKAKNSDGGENITQQERTQIYEYMLNNKQNLTQSETEFLETNLYESIGLDLKNKKPSCEDCALFEEELLGPDLLKRREEEKLSIKQGDITIKFNNEEEKKSYIERMKKIQGKQTLVEIITTLYPELLKDTPKFEVMRAYKKACAKLIGMNLKEFLMSRRSIICAPSIDDVRKELVEQ